MKHSIVRWLQCADCGGSLDCEAIAQEGGEAREGRLTCSRCQAVYPIVGSISRFVPGDSYAQNFSFEWNVHRTTQVDSLSGRRDSEVRFLEYGHNANWAPMIQIRSELWAG